MQLSMLIGKPVLSPAGEAYGYVTAARPSKDFTHLACLIAVDSEEEEFVLPARAILSLDDAVIAGRARLTAPTGTDSPIGKEMYAHTGERLGTVCDLLFGDGGEAILIVSKDGVRTTATVATALIGEHIVLYPDKTSRDAAARGSAKRKIAASSDRPPRPRPAKKATPAQDVTSEATAKETAMSVPETSLVAPMSATEPSKTTSIQLLNRTNLLGRKVKRSVYDEFGVPVAIAGERITPAVLSRARRCNRLLALSVNTLTNLY